MIDRKRGYYDEAAETMPAAKRARRSGRCSAPRCSTPTSTRRRPPEDDEAGVRPGTVKEPDDLRRIPLTRRRT